MRAELLDVVTVINNPIRWHSRIRLFKKFVAHMLDSGVRLTVVECEYGERPFQIVDADYTNVNIIHVRAHTMLWLKENLINIGISRLPPDWKYLCWADADIMFRHLHWAAETVHALQLYQLVQPWAHCYDLGPDGEHLQAHTSFCKVFRDGGPICGKWENGYTFPHPGFAWAATRQAFDWLGGMIEIAILGAGDHHMALSLVGKAEASLPGNISQDYKNTVMAWQQRATTHICQNISYVPGTIEHQWHGPKERRAYVDRWQILTSNNYDPVTDIKKNSFGVLELTGNKPRLRYDIDRYFRSRNEDSNTV
jgi:hypothetical protein